MGRHTRMFSLVLGLMVAGLVGCQPPYRVLEEREALYIQNQELQDQLNQARAALEVTERDRSNLIDEIDDAVAVDERQTNLDAPRRAEANRHSRLVRHGQQRVSRPKGNDRDTSLG